MCAMVSEVGETQEELGLRKGKEISSFWEFSGALTHSESIYYVHFEYLG